jgi:hypothetical protein
MILKNVKLSFENFMTGLLEDIQGLPTPGTS